MRRLSRAPARGASAHGPDCGCLRCIGFGPANTAALTHGSYATVRLTPRARELEDELRELVPFYTPAYAPVVALAALTLARIERASAALEEEGDGERLARLAQDLRGWISTSRRLLNDLGLSPSSQAALARDLGLARSAAASAAARRLEEHIAARRGEGGAG